MRVAFFQRIFAHYQGGLVQALAGSNEHVYYFFGDKRDPCDSGIQVFRFGESMPYRSCRTRYLTSRIAWQWQSVVVACSRRFDVLILEGSVFIATNWIAIILARATGKRVLLYGHGWLRRDTGVRRLLKTTFYKLADGLLLYGKRAQELGVEAGFEARRLYVAYNSLDANVIEAQRRQVSEAACQVLRKELFGAQSEWPMLLSVGRLTKTKRLDLLLEAARILGSRGNPVTVHLVGDGPEKSSLQQIAEQSGISVRFSGAIHDEQRLSLLISAAEATVIPGAAGLSVIHSLSYGTPVVTNDDLENQMPEVEAILPGETGLFFRASDAVDLSDAIVSVLTRLPRREQTRAQCRTIVDVHYNPRSMLTVFDAAVAGRAADGE